MIGELLEDRAAWPMEARDALAAGIARAIHRARFSARLIAGASAFAGVALALAAGGSGIRPLTTP